MKLSHLARAAAGYLRTDSGKKTGSTALQKAAEAANGLTKNKHADKLEKARAEAEKRLRDFR